MMAKFNFVGAKFRALGNSHESHEIWHPPKLTHYKVGLDSKTLLAISVSLAKLHTRTRSIKLEAVWFDFAFTLPNTVEVCLW